MVDHGDLVIFGQRVQDILVRGCVVVVIRRLLRQAEAAAGTDLLELGRVGEGIIDLVDRIAGNAEDRAVLHIDINVPAKQAEIRRDIERLVTGQLARPGGKRIACARQIGAFVAGQRGGVTRQTETDLQIRHGVHQAVEHIALIALQRGVRDLGAEHGVVDQQARRIARSGGVIVGGDARVDPLHKRVLVDVLRPARADIARSVLAENDEQHLCKLADRHMVRRAEAPAAADDNVVLGAVGDIICSPRCGAVIERSGGVLGLRLRLAQKRHQLGDLFAPDGVLRAEAAVRIAGDQAEVVEHPHGVVVFDLLLVGKACKVRCCAGDHKCQRQHSCKQRAKQFFQGDAPFHVYLYPV